MGLTISSLRFATLRIATPLLSTQLNATDTTMRTIRITAEYDSEASVWVAQSDDIGLATEAPTIETLRAKLPGMIFDLISDDSTPPRDAT